MASYIDPEIIRRAEVRSLVAIAELNRHLKAVGKDPMAVSDFDLKAMIQQVIEVEFGQLSA